MRLTTGNAVSFEHKNQPKGDNVGEPAVNQKLPVTNQTVGEAANNVSTPTRPVEQKIEVTAQDKMMFWNHLNDVQYGIFNPESLEKLNTWIIGGNGKWLVQKNEAGYFGVKKSDEGIDTLPDLEIDDAFVHLTYGKIPQNVLDQIIAFFRGVMRKHNNGEAFCQVYYDKTEEKYIVHVPAQQVSGASVRYDKTKDLDKTSPERYVFVYECHSHNNMGAFWSGTDNADESDLRIFGVYGKLGSEQWVHKHRTFVGEEEIDLTLDCAFETVDLKPSYKVTVSEEESYVVDREDIAVDESPRYMVQIPGTEDVIEVRKDQIKRVIKPEAAYPENWMNAVNMRPVSTQYQSMRHGGGYRRPQFPGSGSYSRSPFIPGSHSQAASQTSEDAQERQITVGMAEETGLEEAVDALCDYTNGFTDPGMTTCLMSIMEDKDCLADFKNSILAYMGEYPDEDVTYVGAHDDMPYDGYPYN